MIEAPSKYRKHEAFELEISSLGWGMWRFCGEDLHHAQSLVESALECGITLFDTADIYGPDNGEPFGASEALLGRVFEASPSLRAKMILASKGGISIGVPYDSSPGYLASAIDASLSRLKVDRIDLWQVHRPDILTHPEEVAKALADAYAHGKIGAVGVSNFTKDQIEAFAHFNTVPFVSTQPQYSPLCLEPVLDGQFDQAMRHDLLVMAWSPLGGGRIANPQTEQEKSVAEALDKVAEDHGVSRTCAAYSWIMAHPARPIPIIGSQNTDRIREAADCYKVQWSRTAWYEVLVASTGEELP